MRKKCPQCKLVNYQTADVCARCGSALLRQGDAGGPSRGWGAILVRRAVICLLVCISVLAGFYASLVFSAKGLGYEQRKTIGTAIDLLESKGFTSEVMLLRRLAVFRGSDNWLNASVAKENAFAAANFPFEIVTVYPDFFTYTTDDLERAAILLHEAKHLQGYDEKEAYEYVWKNRAQLGWTSGEYAGSTTLDEIRKQTRDYAPHLFVCPTNPFGDCTETSHLSTTR